MSQGNSSNHGSKSSRNKSIATDKDILEFITPKKPLLNQLSSNSNSSHHYSHTHLTSNSLSLPPSIDTHTRSTSLGSLVGVGNPSFGLLGGPETALASPGALWTQIQERIAPLFQSRGLKCTIDELNELVSRHLSDAGPSIVQDVSKLYKSGMETMGIKLAAVLSVVPPTEEGELIYLTRLTDIWHYFYTTTLILLEAVFLPLNQPFTTHSKGFTSLSVLHGLHANEEQVTLNVDIRLMGLVHFKDDLIWPIRLKLQELLGKEYGSLGNTKEMPRRLIQMLCILAGVTQNEFECEYLQELVSEFLSRNML